MRGIIAASGQSFLPESLAIFAAMSPQPDSARKALINSTVSSLISSGIWAELDLLYILAAHAEQPAQINWKNPGTFTLTKNNSPSFTVDRGFTGNSTNAFLNSGAALSSLTKFATVPCNLHVSAWSLSNIAETGNRGIVGPSTNTPAEVRLIPRNSSNQSKGMARSSSTSFEIIASNSNGSGFFLYTRQGNDNQKIFRNGLMLGSSNLNMGSPISLTGNFALLRSADASTNYSGLQIAQASIGGLVNEVNFYNIIHFYMQTVGALP